MPSGEVRVVRTRLIRALPVAGLLTVSLAVPAVAGVINGTSGPDNLVGTTKADTLRGYGGADRIYGKAGADRIYAGNDGNRDFVYGGSGNDRIYIRWGDRAYAGRGNDVVIRVNPSPWKWTIVDCGPGYDRLYGYNGWLMEQHHCEVNPDR